MRSLILDLASLALSSSFSCFVRSKHKSRNLPASFCRAHPFSPTPSPPIRLVVTIVDDVAHENKSNEHHGIEHVVDDRDQCVVVKGCVPQAIVNARDVINVCIAHSSQLSLRKAAPHFPRPAPSSASAWATRCALSQLAPPHQSNEKTYRHAQEHRRTPTACSLTSDQVLPTILSIVLRLVQIVRQSSGLQRI